MHTAYMPPAEETWHMKWCVKYIFVSISVAHLCHGVTCAITMMQWNELWTEWFTLEWKCSFPIPYMLFKLFGFISALNYNLCNFLINLFDCNSLCVGCLWNTKEWHKNSVIPYDSFYKSHVTECAAEANLKLKLFIRAKSYNVLGS